MSQIEEKPTVHPAQWTSERVAAFWDNYGSIPHFRSKFFSLVCSEGILEFVERFVSTKGVLLDYGCGRGDLMNSVLRKGGKCMGCDSSPENVRTSQERFTNEPGFLGAFLTHDPTLPAEPNIITVVEVIEHMPSSAVHDFLLGISKLLQPGGCVVITCPNSEDIADAEVLCPECACRFHPVQHMQSLAPPDVAAFANRAGFEKVFSGATRFRRSGESRIISRIIAGWHALFGKSPHLVYIGRKR